MGEKGTFFFSCVCVSTCWCLFLCCISCISPEQPFYQMRAIRVLTPQTIMLKEMWNFHAKPSLKARDASDGDQSVLNTMIHSQRLSDVFFSSFAIHLFHFRLELVDGAFPERIWIRTLSLCLSNTGTRSFTWKVSGGGSLTHRQNTVRCFHSVFSTQR